MTDDDHEAAAIRPYFLTGGRTRASKNDLAVETVVATASGSAPQRNDDPPEYRSIAELAVEACSIIEIAAELGIPIGVARVLVTEMVVEELLEIAEDGDDKSDVELIRELIQGIKAL